MTGFGVGVVGYGAAAQSFIQSIAKDGALQLRWVVEDDTALLQEASQSLRGSRVRVQHALTYNELLRSDSVQLVVVCGKLSLRSQRIKEALENNKNVLADSFVSREMCEVKALFTIARRQNKFLSVFLPGRTGSHYTSRMMSCIASSSRIEVQRLRGECEEEAQAEEVLAAGNKHLSQDQVEDQVFDLVIKDCSAVNFCCCMRPVQVSASPVRGVEQGVRVDFMYPNQCEVTTTSTAQNLEVKDQKFILRGDRLSSMSREDEFHNSTSSRPGGVVQEGGYSSMSYRFTQKYEAALDRAVVQARRAMQGAGAGMRTDLVEQSMLDCIHIARQVIMSLKTQKPVDIDYWYYQSIPDETKWSRVLQPQSPCDVTSSEIMHDFRHCTLSSACKYEVEHDKHTVLYGKGKQLRSKLETVAQDGIGNVQVIMDFNLALTAAEHAEEHQEAIIGPREEGKEPGPNEEGGEGGTLGHQGRRYTVREDVKELVLTLKEKKIPLVFYSSGHFRTWEEMADGRLMDEDLRSFAELVAGQSEGTRGGGGSQSSLVKEARAIMSRSNVFVVGDGKSAEQMAAGINAKCLVKLAFLHGDERDLNVYLEKFDLLAFGDMSLQPISSLFCKLFSLKINQGA
ncbi:hypothetical protein GUITHDRAFT_136550 [Guillardia theta CCMP2712]|uniref:Gfo/Idh/MocA-like oxidoreductase N-terminal domain-containing protein n=1 Tax=Guillardia theta (strain CCMP2712) TaxID=905079 RepID=L1JLA8_GUITC|nr:hypothetical protein GUITHDRAFT_136550 [Guillardia theta CCMP2712]EKX48924.1 hypothetical protein GUITHDRAFT_136550 [Guillardia theta CCMP2712]|eukprot:XP_005835904.1 hypothetical protein GUITHDRAFT_136550 [Guillardia theta CCMP2712]